MTEREKELEVIDRMLARLKKEANDAPTNEWREAEANLALWRLLTEFRDRLPALNGYFQKAFRQVDVTGSGHLDMAIWHLLNASKLFWRIIESFQEAEK